MRFAWTIACTGLAACSVAVAGDGAAAPTIEAVSAAAGPYALAGVLGWRFLSLLDRGLTTAERGLAIIEDLIRKREQ